MKLTILFLVGILFASSMAVIGYFTVITEGGPMKKEGKSMKIYFSSAEGIKVGNKVTVQGVPYGYVSNVALVNFDMDGNLLDKNLEGIITKVEISVVLKGPIKLYSNHDIKIKNESLLSGRVIAIDPGFQFSENQKVAKATPNPVVDPYSNDKKFRISGKTNDDPLVSLSELIAENRGDIRKTISNLAEITGKINQGKGTLGKLINNDEVHANVNTTLTDAQIVLRELREGLEDTREQAPVTSFIRAALSAF